MVRRFIESLFITHTEAKLNTSGRLLREDNDSEDDHIDANRGLWCRNIVYQQY